MNDCGCGAGWRGIGARVLDSAHASWCVVYTDELMTALVAARAERDAANWYLGLLQKPNLLVQRDAERARAEHAEEERDEAIVDMQAAWDATALMVDHINAAMHRDD